MNNLFLTGDVAVGKTTVLKEIIKRIDGTVGGYMTQRVIDGHFRSYIVKSLYDKTKTTTIARVDSRDLSKEVFDQSFSTDILAMLEESIDHTDVTVLDELGFMENDIDSFTSKIYELLDSEQVVIGVLKDYDCEFLNNIRNREDTIIIRITGENRDMILRDILARLKTFNITIK